MFNNNGLGGSNDNRMSIVRRNSASASNNAPAAVGVVNPAFIPDELNTIFNGLVLTEEQIHFLGRVVEVDHEYKPEKMLLKVADVLKCLDKAKVRDALRGSESANNTLGQTVVARLAGEDQLDRIKALMELGSSDLEETAFGEIIGAQRSLRSAVSRIGVHARRAGYAALAFLGIGTAGLIGSTIAASIGAYAFMGTLGMMASGGLMAIGVIIGLVVIGAITYQAAKGPSTPEVKYVQDAQTPLADKGAPVTRGDLSGIDRTSLSDDLKRMLDILENMVRDEADLLTRFIALLKIAKADPKNAQKKDNADQAKEEDRKKIAEIVNFIEELLDDDNVPAELKIPPDVRLQLTALRTQYLARLQALDSPDTLAAMAAGKVDLARQLERLQQDVVRAHHAYLNAVARSYPDPLNPSHEIEYAMRHAKSKYAMALNSIIQYLNIMLTMPGVAENEKVARDKTRWMLEAYSQQLDALNSSDIHLVSLVNVLKFGYDQAKINADKEQLPPSTNPHIIRTLQKNRDALRKLQDAEQRLMDSGHNDVYLRNLERQQKRLREILAMKTHLDHQIPESELDNAFGMQLEVEGQLRRAELALVDYKIGQLNGDVRPHAREAARAARDRGADGAVGGANDSSNLVGGANNGPANDGGAVGGANNDLTNGGGAVGGAGDGNSSGDSDDDNGNGGPNRVDGVRTPTEQADDRLDGLLARAGDLENAVLTNQRPTGELEQELDRLEGDYAKLKTDSASDGVNLDPFKQIALELGLVRIRLLLNKGKTSQDGWDKKDGSAGGPNSPAARDLRGLLNDARGLLDARRPRVTGLGPNHPRRVELAATMANVQELIDLLETRLERLQPPTAPPLPPAAPPLPPPPEPPRARVSIRFGRGAADDEQGAVGGGGATGGAGQINPLDPSYRQLAINAARDSLPFDNAAAREFGMVEVRNSFVTLAEKLKAHLRKAVADGRLVKEGDEKTALDKLLSPDHEFPPFRDPNSPQPQRMWFNEAIDYFTFIFKLFKDAEIPSSGTAARVNTLGSYMGVITSLRDLYYASGAKAEVGLQLYQKVVAFMKEAEGIKSPTELADQEAQRQREDQIARSRSLRLDTRPRSIARRETDRRTSGSSSSSDAPAHLGADGRK